MEEFGLMDSVKDAADQGEEIPPPIDHQELRREEVVEEEVPQAQPEIEKERKRKWLQLDRSKRLAIRRLHHMTGHASTSAMQRMLISAGTAPEVVAAFQHFRCGKETAGCAASYSHGSSLSLQPPVDV